MEVFAVSDHSGKAPRPRSRLARHEARDLRESIGCDASAGSSPTCSVGSAVAGRRVRGRVPDAGELSSTRSYCTPPWAQWSPGGRTCEHRCGHRRGHRPLIRWTRPGTGANEEEVHRNEAFLTEAQAYSTAMP